MSLLTPMVEGYFALCLADAARPGRLRQPSLSAAARDLVLFVHLRGMNERLLLVEFDRATASSTWGGSVARHAHDAASRLGRAALVRALDVESSDRRERVAAD